jgi:ribosomal protein S18 acetylase RimI-like enzyme
VILRQATLADASVLAEFDLGGDASSWLDEVREIVGGLVAWCNDTAQSHLGRRVLVGEEAGEIVAVTADECLEDESGRVLAEHRYLMVVAVRADRRRSGAARLVTESLFAMMQSEGTRTVRWLVHPSNHASVAFSRSVFPEADETYPPEDRPYAAFSLTL